MSPDLDRFLAASLAYALRGRPTGRRASDRRLAPQAGREAAPRRLLDVVGGFTWPELVALELMRQEDEANAELPSRSELDGIDEAAFAKCRLGRR